MQVTGTTSSTSIPNSQAQPTLPGQTLNQVDFLKLLVAQLSAQDPMNPVSDTDFAAQMAQFSTLQATQAMQTNLAGLESSQAVLQANSLLGRTVQVKSASGATTSGVVSAIGIQAGTPSITVNGQSYDLSAVLSVSMTPPLTLAGQNSTK
jgi:flagellar basal-body rod modification protein FlgD